MTIDPTIVVLMAGAAGVILGSLSGAWISGVVLWKGPAIALTAAAALEGFKRLLLTPLSGFESLPLLLELALFLVLAGLVARLLGVSSKAAAVVAIGSFVGLLALGGLSLFVVPLEQVNL